MRAALVVSFGVDRDQRLPADGHAPAIIVGDVSKDVRYLPAFHTTRSEIIVPMRNDHRHVLGMLDADSDKLNAFDDEDLQFLERAGGLIAHCLH